MTPVELEEQGQRGVPIFSELRAIPQSGLADLDLARVDEVLRSERDPVPDARAEDYLRARRLVGPEGASLAAILVYGLKPQRWLPQAVVMAASHDGVEVGPAIADVKEFGGRIDQQYAAAFEFITHRLRAPRDFSSEGNEDRGVPAEAVRHALINALVHRDYDLPAPVRVHVFSDRLEIVSPGRLLNTLSVEAMTLGYISLARNPRTYGELQRMGLVTAMGVGVRRMHEAMRERRLPPPEIRAIAAEIHVILRLAV